MEIAHRNTLKYGSIRTDLEYTLPHISFQSPITTVAESTLNKSLTQLHNFFFL